MQPLNYPKRCCFAQVLVICADAAEDKLGMTAWKLQETCHAPGCYEQHADLRVCIGTGTAPSLAMLTAMLSDLSAKPCRGVHLESQQ